MHEITSTFRRVLVAIADQPLNFHDLATIVGVSETTAKRHLRDGRDKGYLLNAKSVHSLTDKGKEAILHAPVTSGSNQVLAYSRASPAKIKTTDYDVYQPPHYSHDDFRPGSMDAYKLPSRTLAGRVWP